MKNISFDNPYLLLVFIPLALAVIIPYFISVSRDNKAIGWKISLGIHLAICAIVTLAIAGIMSVTVLTRTTVYVVADVSYSSDRNLDEIDERILEIKNALPKNSRLGVICFGKNCIQLTPAGRAIKSVSEAKVDKSATDIVNALTYTDTLFETGEIKRIVLITDGNDTVSPDTGALATVVDRLVENGVKIDTVFINNTLKEGEIEVQASDVSLSSSAYLGHDSEAKLLVQSSADLNLKVNLYARERGDSEYREVFFDMLAVESGMSTVTLPLITDAAGDIEYRVSVSADGDISAYNNELTFAQTVEGKLKVLLISGKTADAQLIENMYGEDAEIDSYIVTRANTNVPFRVEDLTKYDEFIVSNVDIRDINHVGQFITSLDTVISQYGKSLIALGDLHIQDEASDPTLDRFEELLPVSYGNSNREGKLYTIVFDISHSINMASKFTLAKEAAVRLISLLDDEDYVCFITFSGQVSVRTPQLVGDCKNVLIDHINGLSRDDTEHGTDIAMGLEEAMKAVVNLNLSHNQVMLISDGLSFASIRSAEEVAKDLNDAATPVSAINVYASSDGEDGRATMRVVAKNGGGKYYELTPATNNTNDIIFSDVSDEVTESIVKKDSTVNIVRYKDDITAGFKSLPMVSGYVQSLAKFDATVPLTVNYEKRQNNIVQVPLYAYRAHGNGRVCALTTSLSDSFTALWDNDVKAQFIENMLMSNTPSERIDYPFNVKLERTDFETYVEVNPSVLNADAVTAIKIKFPSGEVKERTLTFDSQKYFITLDSTAVGAYVLDITYTSDGISYDASISFDVPYLPEYNAFATFDKTNVYAFMHGRGTITEGEIPSLENDESEVATYKVRYTIPLLIAAVVLFIADIIVRKLRINKKIGNKKASTEKKSRIKKVKKEETA